MDLTRRQSEAVAAPTSVAVTAGAGTGKTAMLAARFVHHVVVGGMSPLEVAAVTFTEKAAAELRSRIREELTKAVGEERAAETDAAQISTIHSLAARICRDFYDLAGLPADFRMLDETDAELVVAEWFDEALAAVPPDIVTGLGYTWLRGALQELYKDPPAARSALEFRADDWRKAIDAACERTLLELMASECWIDARDILYRYRGADGDRLETVRVNVVNAMSDMEAGCNISAAFNCFEGFRTNGGSAKNWSAGLDQVRDCLTRLRDAFRACREMTALEFGRAEEEMLRRAEMLREAFTAVYAYIRESKRERRVLDFADLEHYAIEILGHPQVRAHYSERWRAILVDEFQDTNPEQERLLRLLSEGGARLTIVGDSKQSIYGFRRADPRVFERFRETIGNDIVLDRTFRTHAGLVTPLNGVFDQLLGDAHQPLEAERTVPPHDGPFLEAHSFCDDDADIAHMRKVEGRYIASEIAKMLDEKLPVWDKSEKQHRPVRPADIAILCRTRAPLDIYIEELIDARIPAVNSGGGDLFETQVAKDLSVLLRFCSDPSDDIALVALLRGPFFAVDDVTLYQLSTMKRRDECWWQLLLRDHALVARPFGVLSGLLKAASGMNAEMLIAMADNVTGYTAVIKNLKQGERRMADWFGFVSLLRRFASMGRSDVVGADRYLKDLKRFGGTVPRPPLDAGDAVSLMTIHAAKGLEWPVVFVPNLSADKRSDSGNICFDAETGVGFKVVLRGDDGKYTREEPAMLKLLREKKKRDEQREAARILYVAMTRARDRLYLTSAGKEKGDFAALQSGLEAAGVEIERHDASYQPAGARYAGCVGEGVVELHEQTEPIAPRFDTIPVTGLVEYAICPKRYKYRFIDGHPGLGDGVSHNARTIGTLTHAALELDISSMEELRPFSDGAPDEILKESLDLARVFRDGENFRSFRLDGFRREVPVRMELNGAVVSGKADLVGDDFVLDFKTDSEPVPDDHAIQLWAYKEALKRSRGIIAYLRHALAYEYPPDELDRAKRAAERAVSGIMTGHFFGNPSESACRRCLYSSICSERFSG